MPPAAAARRLGAATPPVPRWIRAAAYAVPLLVVPSALFRLYVVVAGPVCHPIGAPEAAAPVRLGPGESLYVVSLSVVSLAAALLTIGLVRPWGEVVPRWVPGLGGRRVPVLAAVVPAGLGVALLGFLSFWALFGRALGLAQPPPSDCVFPESGPEFLLIALAYAPLLAWAPLLAAVSVAYYRRRTRPAPGAAPEIRAASSAAARLPRRRTR
jgi:hypothetical protein